MTLDTPHSKVLKNDGSPKPVAAAPDSDPRLQLLIHSMAGDPAMPGKSKVRAFRNALFDMIERGMWRPGDRLPGEKEFTELLSLSLGTVQSALRDLADKGLLERRRGKGTFVANARDLGSSVWHFRFRRPDGSNLLPWDIRVLSVEEIEGSGAWSDFLGFAPSYIVIYRLIRVNDEFNVYSEVYLEGPRFRPLLDIPLEVLSTKNLRIFLHERYNAPTFRAIHRVATCRIEPQHARLIGCPADSPGINMKALSFTFRDAPISYQRIIIPATPYELELLG